MRPLKKYLITVGVGLLAVLWLAWGKELFLQTHPVRIYSILCDAFFAVGAVITGVGVLIFTANEGVYDMLTYGMESVAAAFRKNGRKRYKSFYDYRMARESKRIPCLFLVICGVIFMAVAAVLYYLYISY